MSQLVKYILIAAFVIFLIGLIWSFSALRKRSSQKTPEVPRQQIVTTSTSTETPSPSGPAPVLAPVPAPTPTPVAETRPVVREEIVYVSEEVPADPGDDGSAEAWASSGVNPDGSTWAEAYAN